jgi:rare lipoprotein A
MRLLLTVLMGGLLAACATAPAPKSAPRPVNPITRLPPQTEPVPAPKDRPAFGTPAFNVIKDAPPEVPVDVSQVPDAVPQDEPLAKTGNTSPYTVLGEAYTILPTAKGFTQTGTASWYGKKFHGGKTSSGDRFDMYGMSAAHRNLPLPTWVRVTNKGNGKSVIVKVNDRGPFHSDRIMDLSYAAAVKLDIIKTGTGTVTIEALDPAEFQPSLAANGKPAAAAEASAGDSSDAFFVQVGAFSKLDNAASLQGKLLDLVYAPISITDGDRPDAVHRVQIGPFYSREDAEKMSQIIRDNKLGEPRIVTR